MTSGTSEHEHRRLRELLGAYALGHLGPPESDRVRAHVDGCSGCRAELSEIQPAADLLDTVDPEHFETPAHPPAELGRRIQEAVAAESRPPGSRRGRPGDAVLTRALLAAAAVVVIAVTGGLVGRATAPEPAAVPLEPVTLEAPADSDLAVQSAGLVPHTWGVELRMVARGFRDGATFRAAFRDSETGELTPAGRFLGTGGREMTCNLQSSLLREDVTEVVVMDTRGDVVLSADL